MGPGIGSNTSASLDIGALATQPAQFLNTAGLSGNPSGVSTFDLLSNDVADHDSGQSGIWWDRNNVTFPNFARYLQYASGLSAGTGRRIMMWQVPAGKPDFDTADNSQGHTPNHPGENIPGHIAHFARAAVLRRLFCPGD